MALTMPKGIQFGFAPANPGNDIALSALTNAVAVGFTAEAGEETPVAGKPYILKANGWPLANNKVGRIGAGGATVEGIDTSDVDLFPAGGYGASSLVPLGDFVDFTQQGDPTASGGEQQFWTGQLLEDPLGRQISMPTFKNAKTITIPLYYDPREPWYDAAKKMDAKGEACVLRAKMVNGDVLYWYGYLSFDSDPSIAANTPMGNTATFTIIGESTLVRK